MSDYDHDFIAFSESRRCAVLVEGFRRILCLSQNRFPFLLWHVIVIDREGMDTFLLPVIVVFGFHVKVRKISMPFKQKILTICDGMTRNRSGLRLNR